MAKLIRSHTECGYRKMGTCLHDDSTIVDCAPLGEQNFPTGCPLEDGCSSLGSKPNIQTVKLVDPCDTCTIINETLCNDCAYNKKIDDNNE